MKLVYKPFSLIARSIGKKLGQAAFDAVWAQVDDTGDGPPSPTAGEVSLVRVAGAHALQAATVAAVGAAIDQLTARWFHHLVGAWPEKPPEAK